MDERTKADNALLKTAFKDNDSLLQTMRALFLGLGITNEDKALIRSAFINPELRKAIRNRFLPQLSRHSPIGIVQDIWMGTEKQVFGQPSGVIYQAVNYKRICIEHVEKALALLENPDGAHPDLAYDPKLVVDEYQVDLLGRNQFIQLVETQLHAFKLVAAEAEPPTAEEKKKNAKKNSSE